MRNILISLLILVTLLGRQTASTAQESNSDNRIVTTGDLSLQFIDPITRETTNLRSDIPVALLVSPSWSPNRTQIVYESELRTVTEIHQLNIETLEVNRLTRGGMTILPRWSPDGRKIAYVSYSKETGSGIYIMNPDGTDQHLLHILEQSQPYISLSWSPDSQSIIYTDNNEISLNLLTITDLGEAEITSLTEDLQLCGEGLMSIDSLSWSRTTEDIATIVSCPEPKLFLLDMDFEDRFRIQQMSLVIDADWQKFGTLSGLGLDWSPDGTQLLFMTFFIQNDMVYTMMISLDITQFLATEQIEITLIGITYGAFSYINPAWQS